MKHNFIEKFMVESGVIFGFLHEIDYENFNPFDFARLIVEECALVVEMNPQYDNKALSNLIKIHFGGW